MANPLSTSTPSTAFRNLLFGIGALAIVSGLVLTILSWLGTCTEACEEGHSYRIFGLTFETLGLVYFAVLAIAYLFSRKSDTIALVAGILLAAGLGAEILFLLIQKYALKHWCPICLGIAASLLIASIIFTVEYIIKLQNLLKQGKRQEISKKLIRAVICMAALFAGFALSFVGISKNDSLVLASTNLQQKIAFGKPDSKIEIYLFTSWECPACKKLEPTLAKVIPPLLDTSKVIFIDHISDEKTLNFSPFNLSFMLYNKPEYLELRKMLRDIAQTTDEPTDSQIEKETKKLEVSFREVNYADVDMAVDYFKALSTKYEISSLPAAVIVDTTTNNYKKIKGTAEVTLAGINQAIKDVETPTK